MSELLAWCLLFLFPINGLVLLGMIQQNRKRRIMLYNTKFLYSEATKKIRQNRIRK